MGCREPAFLSAPALRRHFSSTNPVLIVSRFEPVKAASTDENILKNDGISKISEVPYVDFTFAHQKRRREYRGRLDEDLVYCCCSS